MIDIHNHILFGVDDGSPDIDASIEMIRDAVNDGIDQIILTPHYVPGDPDYTADYDLLESKLEILRCRVKEEGLDITLHLGNELYIDKKLDQLLEEKKVHTLAGSKYVLVEFPMDKYIDDYDEYLYNIGLSGYQIIIAHPERYAYVKNDYNFVRRWTDEGYLLQANSLSLNSRKKAKVVFFLIDEGLLHFIASDAHNADRPAVLTAARSILRGRYDENIIERLFVTNPQRVIDNKPVEEMPKIKKRHWFF